MNNSISVYAAQPREGTETGSVGRMCGQLEAQVYAAQPREGTETNTKLNADAAIVGRFMQLNPARGRKLPRQDL